MRLRNIVYFLLFSFCLGVAAPKPAPNPVPKHPIPYAKTFEEARRAAFDTAAIHKQYVEGDFEEAIDKLESA